MDRARVVERNRAANDPAGLDELGRVADLVGSDEVGGAALVELAPAAPVVWGSLVLVANDLAILIDREVGRGPAGRPLTFCVSSHEPYLLVMVRPLVPRGRYHPVNLPVDPQPHILRGPTDPWSSAPRRCRAVSVCRFPVAPSW